MKHWRIPFILLACLLAWQVTWADEATALITRKILLPDGKPAVGVSVIFRTISYTQQRLLQEAKVTTDADGVAAKEMIYERPSNPHPMTQYGYLMVDAPEYALAFGQFQLIPKEGPKPTNEYPPLKLAPAYVEEGTVIDKATQAPVDKATVAVTFLGGGPFSAGMPVNIPSAGIATPSLTAISGADGTIRLRGMTLEAVRGGRLVGKAVGSLTAVDKIGEKFYTGELSNFTFGSTLPNPKKLVLALSPAMSVSGRVINALTKKPLAGATVTLRGNPGVTLEILPTVITDADGHYVFPMVPVVRTLFVVATGPDFGGGYTEIPLQNTPGDALKPMGEPAVAPDIALRPLTTVRGKVVDAAIGKAPLTEMHISAMYAEGYNDGSIAVGRKGVSTTAAADGTFTLRIPVGYSRGYITGIGYSGLIECTVTPDNPDLGEYTVQREKGFFVQFKTADPEKLQRIEIQMRNAPGAQPITIADSKGIDPHGYWFFSPANRGNVPITEIEIRLIRNRDEEVLPWMKITLDPAVWPLVITIP